MISIAETRQTIVETISNTTEITCYSDIVPSGTVSGLLVDLNGLSVDALTIEGGKSVIACDVDIISFSFQNREEADENADTVIEKLDGKQSSFFNLISLESIVSAPYDESNGSFVNMLTFTFYVKENKTRDQ